MKPIKIREDAFKYYFYFISERMNIYWSRFNGRRPPFTQDKILAQNKFTNVYRILDRVSQYLVSKVIYNEYQTQFSKGDIVFRIILFKIFNRIETWEYIIAEYGEPTLSDFNPQKLSDILSRKRQVGPIYSGAYMMTGSHSKYNHLKYKHEKWLQMVKDELVDGGRIERIINAKSLKEVYEILRECSFLGEFLAYQYTIDLNYSSAVNFDENDFVVAGIGAKRGIKKCFVDADTSNFEKYIQFTHENFEYFMVKYGHDDFKDLFGRKPTLIDLQNCFCEVDKYLRVKKPELNLENSRIKQKFKYNSKPIRYFFPPKWNINQLTQQCLPPNSTDLTLF